MHFKSKKTKISIVTPCYNEEDNVEELYERLNKVSASLDIYDFEFLVIDNCSTDNTVNKLRHLSRQDPRLKIIINTRNFGHIRSPYYGILQSDGDATIYLASDLQDPPEMIPDFIKLWNEGYKVVFGVKPISEGNTLMNILRKTYYKVVESISEAPIIRDATGFGLYDKDVILKLRIINDPYPFLRALVAELGFPTAQVVFKQPRRSRGLSKNNFYTLYDIAWLGLVGHSKVPLRIASFFGILVGIGSIIFSIIYICLKIAYWNTFPMGTAPMMIGMFFLFGIQFLFIGILGEYLAVILTYVQNRPIVVESERIGFEKNGHDHP